ncbi:MAG: long-chain fatty acid--CoA ligase [Acidobacteriota bacterium]|nr:long-chain fatty acid--CoA ligase [Acidobacteriota bacterium]
MNPTHALKPWLTHYRVPYLLPLASLSVLEAFEERARQNPDAPAIRYFDDSISFGQLNRWAESFAALLKFWDIVKGDRVALSLQNDPQFAVAQYAIWKRGGIVVPLNPMFREKELRYHMQDSGARVWVALDSLDTPETRAAVADSAVEHVVITTETDFAAMLTETPGNDAEARPALSPEDIAYLVYTSGTTGQAKGAMLTHGGVAFNAEAFRIWMEVGPADSILGLAPLFHVTGLIAQLALSAWAGAPLILFHRFDPERVFRLCRKWNATISVAAITAYIALMNRQAGNATFLSKCYSGGAPVAPGVIDEFERKCGAYIHNIYGLTESTSPSHAVPLGARAPVDAASGALSIGVPIPNCDAKIVSLEDPDQELPPGEAGELLLRGPMMFPGYWNKPDETAKAFHDGYFRTGDVALMDADGWFYLVDRKKDMIVASGFKVWPREVEDTLYQHAGVREAAVIGVPDAYRGETVKAFVALKEGFNADSAELIQFCRDRISAYKCPREVVFVDEIPKTATGKFLRRALRG